MLGWTDGLQKNIAIQLRLENFKHSSNKKDAFSIKKDSLVPDSIFVFTC